MKHRILVIVAFLAVAGILCVGSATGVARGHHRGFSNEDLSGVYILQATGTNFSFPTASPLSAYNGPFAANGIIWADGQGKMMKKLVVSYNGNILHFEFESHYQVNPDGTFTESFYTSPTTIVTYEGVLIKNGKEARLIVSGNSAMPSGYAGMVVSGSMIRQDEDRDGD
jgi:hypothetical protein